MAVASEDNLLAQSRAEQVVVALPGEIDVTSSPGVREALLAAIGPRPAVVIADMTATTFCDSSGMGAIVCAYRRAVEVGTDLRVVIGHSSARRVFELQGVDTVIGIYPDLSAALG
jgi:anti-anti-sigma factor